MQELIKIGLTRKEMGVMQEVLITLFRFKIFYKETKHIH